MERRLNLTATLTTTGTVTPPIGPVPPDTAAALESAIDAIACRRCDHDDPIGSTDRAALHRAITAHVEAEVARRLAAAPDVEAAIVDYAHAAQSDFDTHEERTTLRAAIAADKARAVAEALSYTSSPTAEQAARDMLERMGVEDAQDFTAGDVVELANLIAEQRPRKPRPTPDESRRLVEALETAAFEWGMRRNNYERDVTATARTALLRALGVEA